MIDIVITHNLLCMQMYYQPSLFFYQQLALLILLFKVNCLI